MGDLDIETFSLIVSEVLERAEGVEADINSCNTSENHGRWGPKRSNKNYSAPRLAYLG